MAIKIFIDQGHNPGTINGGASGNGLSEESVNFTVGSMLADMLDSDPRFAVRTSRIYPTQVLGSDTTSSLRQRVNIGKQIIFSVFMRIIMQTQASMAVNVMYFNAALWHGISHRIYWQVS